MNFDNLLVSQLVGAENTEVVVSRVTVPPNTTLPKHWHPGEEFAYILEGSLILWQDGKEEEEYKKGDVCVVPYKPHFHDQRRRRHRTDLSRPRTGPAGKDIDRTGG